MARCTLMFPSCSFLLAHPLVQNSPRLWSSHSIEVKEIIITIFNHHEIKVGRRLTQRRQICVPRICDLRASFSLGSSLLCDLDLPPNFTSQPHLSFRDIKMLYDTILNWRFFTWKFLNIFLANRAQASIISQVNSSSSHSSELPEVFSHSEQ